MNPIDQLVSSVEGFCGFALLMIILPALIGFAIAMKDMADQQEEWRR